MTASIDPFRQALSDFVEGRLDVRTFHNVYSRLWDDETNRSWKEFDAEQVSPVHMPPDEFDRKYRELAERGAVLPQQVQRILDHIYTDLDVLDRPNGITADELLADCKEALVKLDGTAPDRADPGPRPN